MLIRSLALFLCSGLAFAATRPTFPVLTYSTFLRDNFTPNAIATDASGNIYLAGSAIVDSPNSQTTALVVKLNPEATQYLYIRYLGGSVYDSASAITVDSAGNAYVVGTTGSPDFPVSSGGNLGTAPAGLSDRRSFVVKLDSSGQLVFSDLLGGSAFSEAQAVVVSAAGQMVVSGVSESSGFPSTTGAYSVSDTVNHPYLLELDTTGAKIIFSATGIGGTALALDSAGNIYVAGTTYSLDYPTTPGAFQTTFPTFQECITPCQIPFQGANQYMTKVDPMGSKLIFSTSVSGAHNTVNTGIAVDSAGDVYLTGVEGGGYPFTVTPPSLPTVPLNYPDAVSAIPFLSKLDSTGGKLLFSVPAGGAGVQLDSNGSAYAGGMLGLLVSPSSGSSLSFYLAPSTPALANVPNECLPNATFIQSSAYVSQVDADAGTVLGSKFIGGSTLNISGVALSGSTLWFAGATNFPDFPFSPNALTPMYFTPGPLPGAYLGAVDFSQPEPPAGTPQIGCILDAADLADAGPVAAYQLLTIFGSGLGPAKGVTAPNNITGELAGVDVSFGSTPSPLLYVSSTQINFAVPADVRATAMQVTVNGVSSAPRQIALTFANPSLFLSNSPPLAALGSGFLAVALNADGSLNSFSNPAHLGSVISVFVNGISPNPDVVTSPLQFATTNGWSVTGSSQATPFVTQVDLRVPSPLVANFDCPPSLSVCTISFLLYDIDEESVNPQVMSTGDLVLGADVYVTRTR